jgi:hypothetical protein
MKIKLQNLQKCEDWYSQYQFLDEVNFKIQKNAQMVQSCIALYDDTLWKYSGDDREIILSDRLEAILVQVPVYENSSDELPKDVQFAVNKINYLEKKVEDLENELYKKDLIIREQMNVISNLANTIRNAIYDGMQFVYPFV